MYNNAEVSDIQVITPLLRVENCELKTIKKNDDGSFTFNFADDKGRQLGHREFVPKKGNVDQETFKKGLSTQVSRIAHISRAFLDEATFKGISVGGTEEEQLADISKTFNEYMSKTLTALQVDRQSGVVGKAKGVKCALKVIYQESKGKYFAALPKVPAFISTENHPKEFVNNPQYDKFEIPKITPDVETKTETKPEFNNTGGGGAGAPDAAW